MNLPKTIIVTEIETEQELKEKQEILASCLDDRAKITPMPIRPPYMPDC